MHSNGLGHVGYKVLVTMAHSPFMAKADQKKLFLPSSLCAYIMHVIFVFTKVFFRSIDQVQIVNILHTCIRPSPHEIF